MDISYANACLPVQQAADGVTGLAGTLLEGMGVDVERGRGRLVAKLGLNGLDVQALGNEKASDGVPKLMDR